MKDGCSTGSSDGSFTLYVCESKQTTHVGHVQRRSKVKRLLPTTGHQYTLQVRSHDLLN